MSIEARAQNGVACVRFAPKRIISPVESDLKRFRTLLFRHAGASSILLHTPARHTSP